MVHKAWPIPVLPPVTKTDLIFTRAQIKMVYKGVTETFVSAVTVCFKICDDNTLEVGIKEIASYLVAAPTFYFVTDVKNSENAVACF